MKSILIKILIIFLLTFSVVIYQYLAYKDTESIVTDFLDVVTSNEKSYIDYGELERYRYNTHAGIKVENVDAEVNRYGVFHNYSKGVIWVKYTIMREDAQGNHLNGCIADSEWFIKKKNGRWIVYDIEEMP